MSYFLEFVKEARLFVSAGFSQGRCAARSNFYPSPAQSSLLFFSATHIHTQSQHTQSREPVHWPAVAVKYSLLSLMQMNQSKSEWGRTTTSDCVWLHFFLECLGQKMLWVLRENMSAPLWWTTFKGVHFYLRLLIGAEDRATNWRTAWRMSCDEKKEKAERWGCSVTEVMKCVQ